MLKSIIMTRKLLIRTISLLAVILIGICGTLQGQTPYTPTVKPGASWVIEIGTGMGNFLYYELSITCDSTEINGNQYANLDVSPTHPNGRCGLGGYVREDTLERQVFFVAKDDPNQEEVLLIDYSLQIGDTFHFQNGLGVQTVDTIRYVNFDGKTVRFIDFGLLAQEGFYEGYGKHSSGLVPDCSGYSYIHDYTYNPINCNPTNSVEPAFTLNASIRPNPAINKIYLNLESPKVQFPVLAECWSSQGVLLKRIRIHNQEVTIDIRDLPEGLLLLRLVDKEGRFLVKKIVHPK